MNAPSIRSSSAVAAAGPELSYGSTRILKGIDFSLQRGKTLALLGPSGCGKTTLLRLVAGLLAPTKGSVSIAGTTVADGATGAFVPPERRALGMVFQDYALWPHLPVGGNVSFPLEMRGVGKAERQARTMRALERVGLSAYADRRASDLSGGQQQRVAIARAIVAEPQLILFDEPLSNLDRELRENMVGELAELISTLGLTAIYVTHDHSEALTLADEVAVMRSGLIEQLASPDDLIERPATPEVADFLRLGCLADIERRGPAWHFKGSNIVLTEADGIAGDRARVLIPVGSISAGETSPDRLAATVLRSQFRGDGHLASVSLSGLPGMQLQLLSHTRLRPGETIGLAIDAAQIRWFQEKRPQVIEEKLEHV
ncbi:ABC transporter ATP-binding protein [Rhizobium sp. WYJ-E13]|uniref:ABC transporter ATP-binding protein n=1 Tax=Rhizobium sp. WYJ-E13 TaxID=2849093 RepID=UPI001C1EED8B|nr:ABC transporter ATP-binding protein [Rhizobium sp. WYJ-E13]QWW70625.1 ABC transporter ATP-binding protein [Rhizobium sp. WYJ-E13]